MTQEFEQPRLLLEVQTEPKQRKEITQWLKPFIVGTDKACNLTIDSEEVSRNHVKFQASRGEVFVTSVGETGKALLNGVELGSQRKHKLLTGDRIYLRKFSLNPVVIVVHFLDVEKGSLEIMQERFPFPELSIDQDRDEILLRGLSLDRWQIFRGKEVSSLSAAEYRLLKELYSNQGRLYSPSEIAETLNRPKRPDEDFIRKRDPELGERPRLSDAQLWDHRIRDSISHLRSKIERESGNSLLIQYKFGGYFMPTIHDFHNADSEN